MTQIRGLFIVLIFIFSLPANVIAQELRMKQGLLSMRYYEDDQRIPRKRVSMLMQKDPQTKKMWKTSERRFTLSLVLASGALLYNYYSSSENRPYYYWGANIVSLGFYISGRRAKHNALLRYSGLLESGDVEIGMTGNGIGFHFVFN